MFKTNKIWLAILLVFALVASGFQTSVLAAGKQGTISVVGTDPNNSLSETIVQYGDNETALDALNKTVGQDNVELIHDPNFGDYINSIYHLENSNQYWSFYINGISAPVGAGSYIVDDNDKLTFKYESYGSNNSVSLHIVDKDGKEIPVYNPISFIGQPTALQLLKVIVGPQKLNFTSFQVNGKSSTELAESYKLQNGDEISFQFDSSIDTPQPVRPTISDNTLQGAIDKVSSYYAGKQIDEWEAVALKQAGKAIPAGYLDSVKQAVKDSQGNFRKITDTEKYSLGILVAGGDPTNFEGYNLIQSIYNGDVTKQGLNGIAYALIALDSANFKVPDTAQWTREKLIAALLEKQNPDGGWELYGGPNSEVDITAMILQALSPYKNQENIKSKINLAVSYLKTQYENGKITIGSSAAQAIIALSALGLDANGSQFTKDNTSLVQFLLSLQNPDGSFLKTGEDAKSNVMETEQGFRGLVAYQFYLNGKGSLYSLPLMPQNQAQAQTPVKVEQTAAQTPAAVSAATGHPLPDTATASYNMGVIGLLFILFGTVFFLKQGRRKA